MHLHGRKVSLEAETVPQPVVSVLCQQIFVGVEPVLQRQLGVVVLLAGLSAHPDAPHVVEQRVIVENDLGLERLLHDVVQPGRDVLVRKVPYRPPEIVCFPPPVGVDVERPASLPVVEYRVAGQAMAEVCLAAHPLHIEGQGLLDGRLHDGPSVRDEEQVSPCVQLGRGRLRQDHRPRKQELGVAVVVFGPVGNVYILVLHHPSRLHRWRVEVVHRAHVDLVFDVLLHRHSAYGDDDVVVPPHQLVGIVYDGGRLTVFPQDKAGFSGHEPLDAELQPPERQAVLLKGQRHGKLSMGGRSVPRRDLSALVPRRNDIHRPLVRMSLYGDTMGHHHSSPPSETYPLSQGTTVSAQIKLFLSRSDLPGTPVALPLGELARSA